MKRREFIALLSGPAVAWPLGASAQQAAKLPRIGYLSGNLRCMSQVLAPNRPAGMSGLCSLLGAKRTWLGHGEIDAFDPSQTLANAPHPVRSLSRGLGDVGNASRLLESRSISQFLCQEMSNLLRRVASSDRVVLLPMTKDARSRLEIRDI